MEDSSQPSFNPHVPYFISSHFMNKHYTITDSLSCLHITFSLLKFCFSLSVGIDLNDQS